MSSKAAHYIFITNATAKGLEQLQTLPFIQNGERQPDGSWKIPVDPEVTAAIKERRYLGETDDELIQRLIAYYKGLN